MFFKPRTIHDPCVQAQYLENIGHKKGKPGRSKQKENQDASKEGKKEWKGKVNKTTPMAHKYKDPKNHCNHCNINGHIEEKCWKLH